MSQADRLTPAQLIKLGTASRHYGRAVMDMLECMPDDSIISRDERYALVSFGAAMLDNIGQRAFNLAQCKAADTARVRG